MGLYLCKCCYEDNEEDNVITYDNKYTEKFYKMNRQMNHKPKLKSTYKA